MEGGDISGFVRVLRGCSNRAGSTSRSSTTPRSSSTCCSASRSSSSRSRCPSSASTSSTGRASIIGPPVGRSPAVRGEARPAPRLRHVRPAAVHLDGQPGRARRGLLLRHEGRRVIRCRSPSSTPRSRSGGIDLGLIKAGVEGGITIIDFRTTSTATGSSASARWRRTSSRTATTRSPSSISPGTCNSSARLRDDRPFHHLVHAELRVRTRHALPLLGAVQLAVVSRHAGDGVLTSQSACSADRIRAPERHRREHHGVGQRPPAP